MNRDTTAIKDSSGSSAKDRPTACSVRPDLRAYLRQCFPPAPDVFDAVTDDVVDRVLEIVGIEHAESCDIDGECPGGGA